jgi:hypothetical protein
MSITLKSLSQNEIEQVVCNGKGAEREAGLLGKVDRLERENARLQMELDASCNAEELRQYRHANQFLITNQGAYERENARLREAGKALRDALAFECRKLGDFPSEIDAWDALVSALPNV